MFKNKNRWNLKFCILLALVVGACISAFPVAAAVEGTIERNEDTSSFDHLGTGYALVGAHAELECQACHTEGVFTNLATQCVDCHNNELAGGVPPNHIPVTQGCDTCHNTLTFAATISTSIDHSTIDAMVCSSCHDGVSATGKHPNHVQTSLECDACHNVNSWVTSSFDHSAIGDQACVGCHNNADATGKSAVHMPTSDICDACHTTTDWIPVVTVDHSQVSGGCDSCHNGVVATGKGETHIVTTDNCNNCHTTDSWTNIFDHSTITTQSCVDCHDGTRSTGKPIDHIQSSNNCAACHTNEQWLVEPANVDHTEVVGICSSCHNNSIAIGKGDTHIDTNEECNLCHSVEQWTPAAVDHTDIVDNCASCHNGASASGKSVDHISSSDNCYACHEKFPASWAPVDNVAVDHNEVTGSCVSCHNNEIAVGKGASHIETSDSCDACHAPGPIPWQPVEPAAVDHNEVVGTCISCHDGNIATGKSTDHLQTTDECDVCHSTAQWIPAAVDHTSFVNNCIDCHNGTNASGKSATHINTTDLCDACHEKFPATWAPVTPSSVDHNQVVGTCASCHDGTIASGKSTSHINSSDNCDACHAPGPTPWQPVAPPDVDHNEVLGTCASCHDGTIASGKSTTHITSSDNCDACHAPGPTPWQPVAPPDVDHNEVLGTCASCHDGTIASGKSTSHINSSDNCDACHLPGPTPWQPVAPVDVDHNEVIGTCQSCHDGTTATGKSTTHITTTDNCAACHAPGPTPWAPVAPGDVDHNEVLGVCSGCHDGNIATGMDSGHIQTTQECDACHSTTAWLPATVDHSSFTTNCVRCHDGVSASGKSANHFNTSDTCEACHQVHPAPWAPVAPADVDHGEVIGTCISCHDGTSATGKSATHINSSDTCDACHAPGPTPWRPVASTNVDHNEVIGVCSSCHDGTTATGKHTAHIQTTDECDVCHSTDQWTPAGVDHTNFANNCIDCHNGTNASGKSATHINTTDICDSCHEKFPATWAPVAPSAVDHNQVIGSCISCHDGTTATGKSTTHISSSDVCDACHAPGPTPWAPLAPADVDHNEVIGTCSGCHDGAIASGKSATHISTTDNCEACHAPAPTPWAPVATADVDHNEVLGTCASCHDGTVAIGKSATHISTTDNCEACHAPAPTPWQPVASADVDHNEVIGTCSSCHDGVIATGQHATHINTTEECDVCHNVGAWLPAAVDHTGFVNNCIDCHNGTDASGKDASHINSSNFCDTCHEPFPATWAPVAASAVDHNQVIGSCASCHDGVVASGKTSSHINASDNCDACHAPGPTPWMPVAPGDVDHNEVIGTCASCHDGTIATGKGPTHINSTEVCDACHQPGPALWVPVGFVDHNEVLGSCSTCHDGVTATGKDPGHVQTAQECDACHSTAAWLPATVDHSNFLTNCVRCHDGISASGKGATHLNTTDVCEACHEKHPANWAPVPATNVDHSEVIGSCISCHDGTNAIGKGTTHIASTDVCDACHEPGPTPWSLLAPSAVDHNEVVGSCVSCHDGTSASGKSITHINSSENCDACHAVSPTPWAPVASGDVDHNEVIGTCISCHDNVIATGQPATHINTTDVCDACHLPGPTPWTPVATSNVDHNEVIGTCVSCHDNVSAVGKGTNHINSSDVCDACHLPAPTPWAPLAPQEVDHNEVIGTCISCHDNVIALGKSSTHIDSTDNCAACHAPAPAPWIPVITVDHNEVLGTCSVCHDGVTATGKPNDHIQTTAECDACHNSFAWLPAGVDHTDFVNNCIDCHDGSTATGKNNGHINSTDLCDACHEKFPATWAPVPSSAVDHSQTLGTCVSCHDGNSASGKGNQHINSTDNCDACHQPGPTPWIPVAAQNVDHNEVIGTCVSCHDNSTAPGMPSDHPTTTDNCAACHITPPGSWGSINMDHNEVTGCESCHNGDIARGKSRGHCPTTLDCDACHYTTRWGNTFGDC